MNARGDFSHLRLLIAKESARLIAESGLRDYQAAKRKAASKLGATRRGQLPSNLEIEQALHDHHSLFQRDTQPARLHLMRQVAEEELRALSRFRPCLVGAVLRGTADEHSHVALHLFVEPPEDVGVHLAEHDVRFELGQRRFRFRLDHYQLMPTYRYARGDVPVELAIFPIDGRRQPPLDPIDGRPMKRADLVQLSRLFPAKSP